MMTDYRPRHLTMFAQPDAAAALIPVRTVAAKAMSRPTGASARARSGLNAGDIDALLARCAR